MIKDSVSKDKSELMVFKNDLGKNVYRKKSYYIVKIEQDVMADNIDEANDKFIEKGGINHNQIGTDITNENDGVTTHYVDADYDESITEYIGKVAYTDDEYAEENGDVEINTDAEENDIQTDEEADMIDEKSIGDFGVDYATKEESDVDVQLNLQFESERGK